MHDEFFGITVSSLMGVIPFYALLSIAACLLLVLVIKFGVNALSGSNAKAGPKLLHVVPIAGVDLSDNAQSTRHVDRSLGPEKGKELPLFPVLLSEEVERLLDQDTSHVAEPKHDESYMLQFEVIEAPEIEPCDGVEAAFERYCAAAKAGRQKNVAGDKMLLQ